jgi:hypothetical protein
MFYSKWLLLLLNIKLHISQFLLQFAGCKIIFFDAGTYIVTSTLTILAGTQIVGEAWSEIAGKGSKFQDMNNPQPVVQVGAPGSSGVVEITDIIFSTIGPAGGAIVVEWNVKQITQVGGGAGMWDSHIRLGGGIFWFQIKVHVLTAIRSCRNQSPSLGLPIERKWWYDRLSGCLR